MSVRSLVVNAVRVLLGRKRSNNVEHFSIERATGWAVNRDDPATTVQLTLHVDGRHALNILANKSRADVAAAGMGPLKCGFDFNMPASLRDGKAHLVELRLGPSGPVLQGGTLRIEMQPTAALAADQIKADDTAPNAGAPQGMVFLDRRRAAIAGWAQGCASVTLRIDGGPEMLRLLDREVPGFGDGALQGFLHALPSSLMNGEPHTVEARYHPMGGQVTGSPLTFQLSPTHPMVEVFSVTGRQLRLLVRNAQGVPAILPVGVMADGVRLDLRADQSMLCADLPANARELVLLDDATDPAVELARYTVQGGDVAELVGPQSAVPKLALSDKIISDATAAFAGFCANPDARFDALWYQHAYPDAAVSDAEAALSHYAREGARHGLSPNAFFDEAAARRLYPDVGRAIAAGRLPCAFALDLTLGAGSVVTQPDLHPDLARSLAALPLQRGQDSAEVLRGLIAADIDPQEAPVWSAIKAPRPVKKPGLRPRPLPAPTAAQSAADSIFAAWVARLGIDSATRQRIADDEAAFRKEIAATSLTAAPLISIIMPSYNRAYTIGEAVQSVLDQSYPNWELLICDDASTDKTAEVMQSFDDPRIRYMHFTKSNGAGARNNGLRFAKGDYIAYLDSDNIWHPLFLDLMLRKLLAAPGSAIAYCGLLDTEIVGAKVELQKISSAPFRPIQLSSRNFMDLNTILHHRRVYDWMGGFDGSLPRLQDWDLMLRYTSIFRPVFVDHSAVFYRRNVAWGQVTHLFTGSGAQDTVNDKTTRRLSQSHERLKIDWPARGSVTVIVGGNQPGDRLIANSMSQLAARFVDIDFVDLKGGPTPEPHPSINRHLVPQQLWQDPYRLSHALAGLLRDRPVLTIGLNEAFLNAILGLNAQRTYRLRMSAQGIVLSNLVDRQIEFHLGAVPIGVGKTAVALGERPKTPLTVLVPNPGQRKPEDLVARAKAYSVSVLAPSGGIGVTDWQLIEDGKVVQLAVNSEAFEKVLADCTFAASLQRVSALTPFQLCLLNSLQARGVPLAVLRETGSDDALADQWLEARAAYEIKVGTAAWVLDKTSKLHADAQTYAVLSERGQRVHQINLHPELAQERLAHVLFRLLFDAPQPEALLDAQ